MTQLQKGRFEALNCHIYGFYEYFNAISGGFFAPKVVFARESYITFDRSIHIVDELNPLLLHFATCDDRGGN